MGCLNIKISRISEPIECSVGKIGEGIRILVGRVGEPLKTIVADISKHITAKCSIVCSTRDFGKYLNVSPTEVQWITNDMGVFFDVESNVEWIIVTS